MDLGRRVEIKTIRPYSLFNLSRDPLPSEEHIYNTIYVDVTFIIRSISNAIGLNLYRKF